MIVQATSPDSAAAAVTNERQNKCAKMTNTKYALHNFDSIDDLLVKEIM